VRLSIVDLAAVLPGGTAADAYRASVELARAAEELGCTRYWVAEHHGLGDAVAAASPEVLIAHLAAETSTIRVGAGTVLLNYAKPLRVAEAYRTLDALHPGRIDLGLGRAGAAPVVDASLDLSAPDPLGLPADMPGGDQLQAMLALTRYEDDVAEVLAWLDGRFPASDPRAEVSLVESAPTRPQPWLLGSSTGSALLAARLGLPYAFAAFFNPQEAIPAMRAYRACFAPSPHPSGIGEPYSILAVHACCADTDAEADRLRASVEWFYAAGGDVDRQPLADPATAAAALGRTPGPVDLVAGWPAHLSGGPDRLASMLEVMVAQTGVNELMVQDLIAHRDARLHSYALLAGALGVIKPEPRRRSPFTPLGLASSGGGPVPRC
jgi:alkanesulfonate monooxygenase SsuD/methylene tetrahydromethanopterin reductase-like flavin-dependent oxidoreductase (luciferase family)